MIRRELDVAIGATMQAFRKGLIPLAKQRAEQVLTQKEREPNALLVLSACLRSEGQYSSAIAGLLSLLKDAPDFALAFQELGFAYADIGKINLAIAYLQRALTLNSGLASSWQKMGELFLVDGDIESSNESFRRNLALANKNPAYMQAVELFSASKFGQSEQLCRQALQRNPNDVDFLRLLADLSLSIGALAESQSLLEQALGLSPNNYGVRLSYAHVLNRREKLTQALTQVDELLNAKKNHFPILVLKASILVKFGSCDPALLCYEDLLANYPPQPKIALSYGHALKTAGRQSGAIKAYRFAIELDNNFGEAYWSLANLKTFQFEDEDIDAMKAQLAKNQKGREDCYFYFSLGRALEQRRQFDESFKYYKKGNEIKSKEEAYRPDLTEQLVQRLKATCNETFFPRVNSYACQATDPIFVLGLPRSGSTLIEQILASHSQVDGTRELSTIVSMARRIGNKRLKQERSNYPEVLLELSTSEYEALGREYIERTRVHRGHAAFFIDKMPNNFFHIGLISRILPNAKIIDARRHPKAACFSNYKQLFAKGQAFSYQLSHLGRYYESYIELMEHWGRVMPAKILTVQYEDLVTDTEHQVRRLLAHCGLEFEEDCLAFYRNERPVRTASSEQVRQPIYKSGLVHWKNFEKHLLGLNFDTATTDTSDQ